MTDNEEFDAYFLQMLPRVIRLAENVTHNRSDAEDVAIETFAKAHLKWRKVGQAKWRDHWILRVATNLAIDTIRKRRPTDSLDVDNHALVEPSAEFSFDDRLALQVALNQLTARQRQAVALVFLNDLTYAESARIMKVSLGSVQAHLQRALKSLRNSPDIQTLKGTLHVDLP